MSDKLTAVQSSAGERVDQLQTEIKLSTETALNRIPGYVAPRPKITLSAKREKERAQYVRLLKKQVSMQLRVEGILDQIADVRFALPAIKYVDQITGVGPIADAEQPKQPQPMFAFAGNDAMISVTIVNNPVEKVVSNRENVPALPANDSGSK